MNLKDISIRENGDFNRVKNLAFLSIEGISSPGDIIQVICAFTVYIIHLFFYGLLQDISSSRRSIARKTIRVVSLHGSVTFINKCSYRELCRDNCIMLKYPTLLEIRYKYKLEFLKNLNFFALINKIRKLKV